MSSVYFGGQSSTVDFAIDSLSHGYDLISRALSSASDSKVNKVYIGVLGVLYLVTGATAGVGFIGHPPLSFSYQGKFSTTVERSVVFPPPASSFPENRGLSLNGTCIVP